MELPDLRTIALHALPRFVEGTVVPLALFLVGLRVLGLWYAMAAGLAWVYGLIAFRLATRRPVSGLLLLGAATLTARTAIALAAHSVVVYFLQPSLGTALVGTLFLLSALLDRPLVARLAADFCPLPEEVHANTHVRRFFRQVSLLWAVAQLGNAALTIWLLFSQSVGTFVVLRTVVSLGVTTAAIAASTHWFKRSMAREGIVVKLPRWRPEPAPASRP